MKIGIIGAGAMGSLLGWYLCESAEVWLLDSWQAHVDAINTSGLWRERDGVHDARRPHATTDPAEIGPCDVVLVLVKAHQTAWAARQAIALRHDRERGRPGDNEAHNTQHVTRHTPTPLRPYAPTSTLVVTLQNGLGNRETLAETLGAARVTQGVTALGATLLDPGRFRHAGQGATVFGAMPDGGTARLAELFRAAGLPADVSDDLDALVWGKLIINVGINALTALLRVPNGALADVPEARALAEQAAREAVTVAHARGIRLHEPDPVAHMLSVARATGANRSSMLQDVLRGSPTEINSINGAVVREGRRLGIPTPVNDLLTALVQALDATGAVRL
jgi:2-dehydropantoate 2-reductase